MNVQYDSKVTMVPIESIHILNSRVRDKKKFSQIVSNISALGLKKPITLRKRMNGNGKTQYDLVCGQGRLEAYSILGQKEIPAVIVEATQEECFLMSLVENLARRNQTTIELVHEIGALEERGYSVIEIASKTDLNSEYVKGIVRLLRQGEERLLEAVEKGKIPISVAVKISQSDDMEMQSSMREAYENHTLRGKALLDARWIIEQRKIKGKSLHSVKRGDGQNKKPSETLFKEYRKEAERQAVMVKNSRISEERLLFIVTALKRLLQDENFTTLLRAEALDTMPKQLFDLVCLQEGRNG